MSAVGTKYWFRNKWGLQNSTPPICPLAHYEPLYYRAFVWDQKQVCCCSLNRLVVLILQRLNWVLRVLLWDAWRWSRVLVANDASIFLSDRRMLYFNECSGIRSRARWKMMRSRTFIICGKIKNQYRRQGVHRRVQELSRWRPTPVSAMAFGSSRGLTNIIGILYEFFLFKEAQMAIYKAVRAA